MAYDLVVRSYKNPQLTQDPKIGRELSIIRSSDLLMGDYCSVTLSVAPKFKECAEEIEESSEVQILGSCNGWLCLTYGRQFGLWQPSMDKFKLLPPFDLKCSNFISVGHRCGGNCIISVDERIRYHSLGYDSQSEDYKFLALVCFSFVDENENSDSIMKFFIYSLNNDSWAELEGLPPLDDFKFYESFVCLGGVCYWNICDSIVSFDFTSETFSTLPYPDDILSINTSLYLINFFGRLGFVIFPDGGMVKQFQFWIWEADEIGFSWKRKSDFDIFSVGADIPLGFCGNPKFKFGLGFLFQGLDGALMKYDYSTKKMIKLQHFCDHQMQIQLFTFGSE